MVGSKVDSPLRFYATNPIGSVLYLYIVSLARHFHKDTSGTGHYSPQAGSMRAGSTNTYRPVHGRMQHLRNACPFDTRKTNGVHLRGISSRTVRRCLRRSGGPEVKASSNKTQKCGCIPQIDSCRTRLQYNKPMTLLYTVQQRLLMTRLYGTDCMPRACVYVCPCPCC